MNANVNNVNREEAFSRLEKATITLSYLRGNSSTHETPFSAIAELCDNAYDADAGTLFISFEEENGLDMLEFLDDGEGMSSEEAKKVISFGHSNKNERKIGQYGNGLKSGGFHLGSELLILTKKNEVQTVLFISHKFHHARGLNESVFVPCPSFDMEMNPIFSNGNERERYPLEMEIIREFAPYYKPNLFSKIEGPSGTLIIISGLKRSLLGGLAFNVTNDPNDIQLDGDNLKPYEASLREYLKILYLIPSMRIYLRRELIFPKKIIENWYGRHYFSVRSAQFRGAYNAAIEEQDNTIRQATEDREIIRSQVGEMSSRITGIDNEARRQRKELDARYTASQKRLDEEKKKMEMMKEERRCQTNIFLYCGVEVTDRSNNGVHFYINNRLIIWAYKNLTFFKKNPNSIGVSMYLNLNYDVFHPTHNKQGFSDAKDFNRLLRVCNDKLEKYAEYLGKNKIIRHLKEDWKDIRISDGDDMWKLFWEKYGYKDAFSVNCQQTPFDSFQNEIFWQQCGVWHLCQSCRRWRRAASPNLITGSSELDRFFLCNNVKNRSCQSPNSEEKFDIFNELWTPIKIVHCPATAPATFAVPRASATRSESFGRDIPSTSGPVIPNGFNVMVIKTERSSQQVEDMPELATEIGRLARQMSTSGNRSSTLAAPGITGPSSTVVSNNRRKTAPEPVAIMDNLDLTDESEDEEETRFSSRRQRKEVIQKPSETATRRSTRRVAQESDADEEEEQPAVAQKKRKVAPRAKTATSSESSRNTMSQDAIWFRDKLNSFLVAAGKPPIEKSGGNLNPAEIYRSVERRAERTNNKLEDVYIKVDKVLAESKKLGLKVPDSGTPAQKLDAVYNDINLRERRNRK